MPNPMLSATVMFGNSAYDWKTMPTLRWFGETAGDVRAVDPDGAGVRYSKPAIMRSVVVLPQPDGPEERDELAAFGGQVEVLDGHDAAEPLLDVGQLQEAVTGIAHQRAPAIWTRGATPRPMTAMRIIASHVSPKLMSDDGRRLVGLRLRPSSVQVGPERRPGQEARDGELADDDGEGQERAAQERDAEVRQDDLATRIVNQPAPMLWAASVRVRTSIAAKPVSTARYMYGNDRTT